MGLEVLPRLTDGGYDLVLVDTSPTDHPRYLDEALRLLGRGEVALQVLSKHIRAGPVC